MDALVVQHLVALDEATRILRFFKQKKHASLGYFFDLQDLGVTMRQAAATALRPYGAEWLDRRAPRAWDTDAYLLRVYRTVPEKAPGPDFTADEIRVLKSFAQHLLEIERNAGVMLD